MYRPVDCPDSIFFILHDICLYYSYYYCCEIHMSYSNGNDTSQAHNTLADIKFLFVFLLCNLHWLFTVSSQCCCFLMLLQLPRDI